MESTSLKTLNTPAAAAGRSRFSKALPAPPPPQSLMFAPRRQPSAGPPALPPKDMAAFAAPPAKPLESLPLPPLPLKPGVRAEPPPSLSIPRRPVGSPALPMAELSPVGSISSLLSAYTRSSEEDSEPKSPEGTASTKISYIAPSPGQTSLAGDLRKDELFFTPLSSSSAEHDSQRPEPPQKEQRGEQERPPPLPMKDARRPRTPGSSPSGSTPTQQQAGSASPGGSFTASPLQPQLWRRRSLKADRNLAVSELKLTESHGSTASSTQLPPPPPQQQQQQQPQQQTQIQTQTLSQADSNIHPLLRANPPFASVNPKTNGTTALPRSSASQSSHPAAVRGLPGRNIRPTAPREPASQPSITEQYLQQSATMGATLSKIEDQVDSIRRKSKDEDDEAVIEYQPAPGVERSFRRLPSPDSEPQDVAKNGFTEAVTSPDSPANPPSKRASPAAISAHQQQQQQQYQRPPPRNASLSGRDIRPVRSTPALQQQYGGGGGFGPLRQQPGGPAAPGGRPSSSGSQQGPFPARTTSRRGDLPSPQQQLQQQQSRAALRLDTNVSRVGGGVLPSPEERGAAAAGTFSDETIPEENEDSQLTVRPAPQLVSSLDSTPTPASSGPSGSTSSAAATTTSSVSPGSPSSQIPPFPTGYLPAVPEGHVFAAPPLTNKNFECLHRHRVMRVETNLHYPVACQACGRADREQRWRCRWCFLRVCGGCFEQLGPANGRDLRRLVDRLERDPQARPEAVVASPAVSAPVSAPLSAGPSPSAGGAAAAAV